MSLPLEQRVDALVRFGRVLGSVSSGPADSPAAGHLQEIMETVHHRNPWFTKEMIAHRLMVIGACLTEPVLRNWIRNYELRGRQKKTILVILAGNIPLAGFDDLLAVLVSGNIFKGKLSSDDRVLLPAFCELLVEVEPGFREQIIFTEGMQSAMDAVIATGSNNSGRYFDHYFSKYPHIIRRNRNGVAVLSGHETKEDLKSLADDIFLYFGAGCRSVSKLFVPAGYDFHAFFEGMFHWGEQMMHNSRYMNNYDYHKTVYLLNNEKLLDDNFLLLREHIGIASPPGVLYYERYESPEEVEKKVRADRELIQCIVAGEETMEGTIPFGTAQLTMPWHYADNADVLKFLSELS